MIMDITEGGTLREPEGLTEEDTMIGQIDPQTETMIEIDIMITMKIDIVMMIDIILTNMVMNEEENIENISHQLKEIMDLGSMGLL